MHFRYVLALSRHLEFQLLCLHIINKNRIIIIIIIITMALPCFSPFVICMYVWCYICVLMTTLQLAIRTLCRQEITEGLN